MLKLKVHTSQMHIATKGSKIDISSEKKLEEFSKNFCTNLKLGDIFFLIGDIGIGKTTFVKYIINHLQFKFKQKFTEVTSPTFNIMNEYVIDNYLIKHYDLFRLNSSKDLQNLDLFDESHKAILFIEWPQIIKKKPNKVTELYFEYENEYQNRFIKF